MMNYIKDLKPIDLIQLLDRFGLVKNIIGIILIAGLENNLRTLYEYEKLIDFPFAIANYGSINNHTHLQDEIGKLLSIVKKGFEIRSKIDTDEEYRKKAKTSIRPVIAEDGKPLSRLTFNFKEIL